MKSSSVFANPPRDLVEVLSERDFRATFALLRSACRKAIGRLKLQPKLRCMRCISVVCHSICFVRA